MDNKYTEVPWVEMMDSYYTLYISHDRCVTGSEEKTEELNDEPFEQFEDWED